MEYAFTTDDKIRCLKRELAMRHRVFPGRVKRGTMTQGEAESEIALFGAMLQDYYLVKDRLARKREPSLFQ